MHLSVAKGRAWLGLCLQTATHHPTSSINLHTIQLDASVRELSICEYPSFHLSISPVCLLILLGVGFPFISTCLELCVLLSRHSLPTTHLFDGDGRWTLALSIFAIAPVLNLRHGTVVVHAVSSLHALDCHAAASPHTPLPSDSHHYRTATAI